MEKKVYIFNCNGTFDLCKGPELYRKVSMLTKIDCDRYGCVFLKRDGKFWSRSGVVKNIEPNIQKYILLDKYAESKFKLLEMYDKPENAQSWDLEKRKYGFFVSSLYDEEFNIYIVLPDALDEDLILDLWGLFSKLYDTNYMVHFALDSKKDVEVYMYGTPMTRGLETLEEYFSSKELDVLDKLHYLRRPGNRELGDVFSVCIATSKILVDEHAYNYKKIIDDGVCIFAK